MSLYDELGLSSDATQDEIKEAYRRRASETHPDKDGGDHAAFIRVKAAYDVLSDPQKRAEYDALGDMEGPEFQLRNTIAQAFSHFAQLDDLPDMDIVKVIREEFVKSRLNARRQLKKLRKVIRNYKRMTKKIRSRNQVVQKLLYKRRGELVKQAVTLRMQISLGGLLLETINEYEYDWNREPAWGSQDHFTRLFLSQGPHFGTSAA